MKDFSLIVIAVSALIAAGLMIFLKPTPVIVQDSFGSAPPGLAATVSTTTSFVVGPTDHLVMATTSVCTARAITTQNSAVQIKFSEFAGGLLNGQNGHALQAASSTVVYDSGQWGCGAVHVYSYSSSTIRVVETR